LKTNQYSNVIKNHEVKPSYLKNMASAFFYGGLVCLVGQGFNWIYTNVFDVSEETASTYMIVTLILIASILTGIGVYDRFGQVAKAGGFIPITGFANSLTSAALEGKSEGMVRGIATNMFKLAGTVIVFAVVSGFVFGLLRYFLVEFGIAPALDHSTVSLIMMGVNL
jgi:stage V sporulation protein AC